MQVPQTQHLYSDIPSAYWQVSLIHLQDWRKYHQPLSSRYSSKGLLSWTHSLVSHSWYHFFRHQYPLLHRHHLYEYPSEAKIYHCSVIWSIYSKHWLCLQSSFRLRVLKLFLLHIQWFDDLLWELQLRLGWWCKKGLHPLPLKKEYSLCLHRSTWCNLKAFHMNLDRLEEDHWIFWLTSGMKLASFALPLFAHFFL